MEEQVKWGMIGLLRVVEHILKIELGQIDKFPSKTNEDMFVLPDGEKSRNRCYYDQRQNEYNRRHNVQIIP